MIHTYAYVDLYFYLCSDRSVVLPLPQQHRDSFDRLCTRCFTTAGRVEPGTGINAWQNWQTRTRPPLGGVGISPPGDNGFLDRSNFIRSIRWIKIPFSFSMAFSFPLVLPPPFLPFLLACIHAFFLPNHPFSSISSCSQPVRWATTNDGRTLRSVRTLPSQRVRGTHKNNTQGDRGKNTSRHEAEEQALATIPMC